MKAKEVPKELDRKRRIEKKPQAEYAKKLDVSPSSYSGYVNGTLKPGLDTIFKMFCLLKNTDRAQVSNKEDGVEFKVHPKDRSTENKDYSEMIEK